MNYNFWPIPSKPFLGKHVAMDNENTRRLFEDMRLRDVALFLQDLSDELEDNPNETVQGLRVILTDTAKRIGDET